MIKTELESFVQKFRQLRKAGINAHLDVHSEGSNAWACLRVQLGEAGQQQHSDPPPPGWVKRGLRRSPAYARRQERRRAARQARQSAAETEKQAEEMLAEDSDEPPAAEKAEEVRVVVNSESRNVKPRDKWMKEDISLIESVIIDTVTSIESIENVLVNGLASFVQQNPKLEDAQILLGDHLSHMWGQFATNPGSFGALGHTAH